LLRFLSILSNLLCSSSIETQLLEEGLTKRYQEMDQSKSKGTNSNLIEEEQIKPSTKSIPSSSSPYNSNLPDQGKGEEGGNDKLSVLKAGNSSTSSDEEKQDKIIPISSTSNGESTILKDNQNDKDNDTETENDINLPRLVSSKNNQDNQSRPGFPFANLHVEIGQIEEKEVKVNRNEEYFLREWLYNEIRNSHASDATIASANKLEKCIRELYRYLVRHSATLFSLREYRSPPPGYGVDVPGFNC